MSRYECKGRLALLSDDDNQWEIGMIPPEPVSDNTYRPTIDGLLYLWVIAIQGVAFHLKSTCIYTANIEVDRREELV